MSKVNYEDLETLKELKEAYHKAVEGYIEAFMKKQGLQCNEWVGGNIGGVIECGDMFFNFDDIVIDIDNNVPKEVIIEWYWYSLGVDEHKRRINYNSWVMGLRGEDIK